MDVTDLIDQLDLHGSTLADAADRAGLTAAVPTCPDWDVRALLAHVGMVHRWATEHISGTADTAPGGDPEDRFAPPDEDVVAWFRDGHRAVVAALRAAPDDLEAMTFLAGAGPARHFWARRQAHETAIHGADAAAALGEVPPIDAGFALDGIGELLEGFYGRRGGRLRSDPPLAVRVAASDADVTWLVEIGPDERIVTRDDPRPADATMRGTSPDLYLHLWNRHPAGTVEVEGDSRAAVLWRTSARVGWS